MGVFGNVIRVPSDLSKSIVNEFDCDTGLVVGDLVVPSLTVDNKVLPITNNTYQYLCIGVVTEKVGDTRCKVLTIGLVNGLSGLSRGKPVFVSPTGTLTTTRPTTGSIQIMGSALSSSSVLMSVNMNKVTLV